jgi:diguanylate cyclase
MAGPAATAAGNPAQAPAPGAYGLFPARSDEDAFIGGTWAELAPRAHAVALWGGLIFGAGTVADYLLAGPEASWALLLAVRALVLAVGLRLAWVTRRASPADPGRLRRWMPLFQLALLLGQRAVVQLHGSASSYQAIAAVMACLIIYTYAPMVRPMQLWMMPAWVGLAALQMLTLLPTPARTVLLFLMILGFVNIVGWQLATHNNRYQRAAWLDRRRLQWEVAERVSAEQNLRHLFEASPVPLVLAGQRRGQLLHLNRAALDLLDPRRLLPDPSQVSAHDFYADTHTGHMLNRALAHHEAFGPVDMRVRDSSQRVLDVMVSARKLRYNGRRAVLASLVEITHRKRHEHELRRLAHTDPLTALHNRRGFFARAEHARRQCAPAPLALLALDVDLFKTINDNHGHAVGDIVLQQLAGRMAAVLREQDLLARIGGEEFAALLPGVGAAEALETAERVRRAVCDHAVRCQGLRLQLSVSVGVALLECEDDAVDDALARADEAMYRAKQTGRNCVELQRGPAVRPTGPISRIAGAGSLAG